MDRFGPDVVSMIKDSNTVEREKLDPNKVKAPILCTCLIGKNIHAKECKHARTHF